MRPISSTSLDLSFRFLDFFFFYCEMFLGETDLYWTECVKSTCVFGDTLGEQQRLHLQPGKAA